MKYPHPLILQTLYFFIICQSLVIDCSCLLISVINTSVMNRWWLWWSISPNHTTNSHVCSRQISRWAFVAVAFTCGRLLHPPTRPVVAADTRSATSKLLFPLAAQHSAIITIKHKAFCFGWHLPQNCVFLFWNYLVVQTETLWSRENSDPQLTQKPNQKNTNYFQSELGFNALRQKINFLATTEAT